MTNDVPAVSNSAVRLFATFGRFEFALKEAGFVRADHNRAAMPDWERFSKQERTDTLIAKIKGEGIAPELTMRPPQRQVVTQFGWGWREVQPADDAASFLRAIRQVRNNLFHGGKSGPDPRDDRLCDEAVACLFILLGANEGVAAAFNGLY